MNPRIQSALRNIMQKHAAAEVAADMQQVPPEAAMPPAEAVPPEAAQEMAQQAAEQPQEMPAEEGQPGPEQQLVMMLVGAYCAEKVSEYQYEFAINACEGKNRGEFLSECEEHRSEEHDHAEKLAERIQTLGGTIPYSLLEIVQNNPAGDIPEEEDNQDTAVLTPQIIEAEQRAVEIYSQIAEATKDTDPVTNNIVVDILEVEQKHVSDMTKVMNTIQVD